MYLKLIPFNFQKQYKLDLPVDEDALNRRAESSVKSPNTIVFQNWSDAVSESFEFSRSSFSNVCGQASSGKVQGIDEAERGGSGKSSR